MTKEEVLSASALMLVVGRANYQFNEEQVVRSLVCHQPVFGWVYTFVADINIDYCYKWVAMWGLAGQHIKFVRQIFHYHYAGKCNNGLLCSSNIYTFGKTLDGYKFQVCICLN